MQKEETILFPKIKEAESLYNLGRHAEILPGYIQILVDAMEADHEEAGDIMNQIRILTTDYTSPQDACTTFKVTLAELKEFEEDLHNHVHIENNILFPKAIQYECD